MSISIYIPYPKQTVNQYTFMWFLSGHHYGVTKRPCNTLILHEVQSSTIIFSGDVIYLLRIHLG